MGYIVLEEVVLPICTGALSISREVAPLTDHRVVNGREVRNKKKL